MAVNAAVIGTAYSETHTEECAMYKRLLVPVDGSNLSERAMRESIALAKQLGAAITGFVVEPDMPLPNAGTQPTAYARARAKHEQRTDGHAHELLSQFGALCSESGIAFSGRHACTDRVDVAIVDTARELECDMIVMVTHGRGVFGELLLGSHTKNVLTKSKIPLLVLH
jgi:nucleotide-binding universal stress UspA family protein